MSYERRSFGGGAESTTLSAGVSAAAESITIVSAASWPDGSAGAFFIVIDPGTSSEEKIRIATRTGTTLTVEASGRGSDGTGAATHSSGATVKHVYTALDADEANAWVAELAGAVNTAGDLPVADGADSLTTLAKGAASTVLGVSAVGTLGYATVATAQIADSAVTNAKMADDAIDSAEIADGAVDLAHMSANSVDSDQYVDGSIDLAHLSANSVDSDQYVDGSIDPAHLANGSKGKWLSFSRPGTLIVGTGVVPLPVMENITILGVRAHVVTAPTGAAVIVDVHLDGVTIFTTQADRPEIAISGTESATEVPAVTSATAGQQFTCDVDQIGSTIAGANLTVSLLVVPA